MAVLGALGDLVLSLSADTAKFQSDLGRANRLANKFGREVGRALGNVAGALVAIGGAAGFGGLVKNAIDSADAAGKLSQSLGLSVEQLTAYQVQARLAAVSNEQLGVGLRQLAKNQADYIAGTGEARAAFAALGITQEQVNSLNGDTAALFELVAGKLSRFEDGANKSALAMRIFGESGSQLLPMINQLEQTRREAAELNAVIDSETASSAERFNDNLTRVGIAVQAVGLNIARAVLPTLEQMSGSMVTAAKDAEGMARAGEIANNGLKLLATGGAFVTTVFRVLGEGIGAVAAVVVQAAQGNFREALAILRERKNDVEQDWQGLATRILDIWDTTGDAIANRAPETAKKLAAPALQSADIVKKAAREAEAAMRRSMQGAQDFANALNAPLVEAAELATEQADALVYTWDAAGNRVAMTREEYESLNQAQGETVEMLDLAERKSDEWGFTFNSALEDAIGNFEELDKVAEAFLKDLARMATRRLITDPLSKAAGDFFSGIDLGTIFSSGPGSYTGSMAAFAGGGRPPVGRASLVGEKGPELFIPDSAGTIVPNDKLGGGTVVQVIDQRRGGEPPAVERTRGPDGRELIRVLVRDQVKALMGSGELDRTMAQNFGVRRRSL